MKRNISLPAKLKSNCDAQIDTVLALMQVKHSIGINMLNYIVDDHVPTKAVFDCLQEIEGIQVAMLPIEKVSTVTDSDHYYLAISEHGDVYHLTLTPTEHGLLGHVMDYTAPDQQDDESSMLIDDLTEYYGLAGFFALNTVKKSNQLPASYKPKTDEEQTTKTHYATAHFTRHMRTISSIIGIAVVLALLGVITPLGFQTFTDKILPYQAQSSLMAIAILLVVAAMVTALFNYFHDYQESVLFAKYQSGLGKDVFDRLLAMEIPYFDGRNVGDLTKLVDQVEEASNFLVKQLLGSIVALISLIVVLPILFLYDVNLTLIVLGVGLLMAITIALSLRPLRQRLMQAYGYDSSGPHSLDSLGMT